MAFAPRILLVLMATFSVAFSFPIFRWFADSNGNQDRRGSRPSVGTRVMARRHAILTEPNCPELMGPKGRIGNIDYKLVATSSDNSKQSVQFAWQLPVGLNLNRPFRVSYGVEYYPNGWATDTPMRHVTTVENNDSAAATIVFRKTDIDHWCGFRLVVSYYQDGCGLGEEQKKDFGSWSARSCLLKEMPNEPGNEEL